jgi:predicted nucleotide-binding protein (sugar kinase/HSP70/actin superfamily)
MSYLKTMGVIPILADCADRKRSAVNASALSDTLPWLCSKELVGAVAQYKDRVDGMALITAFPCGPDSLVNDILIRRVKNLPILMLTLDGQEGTAGMETRLESFIDIIRFRREDAV